MRMVKLVMAAGLAAMPLAAKAAGNVDVSADALEIFDAEHKTIFRGNVVAVRPSDTTRSDEMVVTSGDQKQSDGTTKSVTQFVDGKGNVNITTKNATITGDWFKLDVQKDQLVVGGTQVVLTQGTSIVKGKELHVNLKTNNLQMSGGRVNSVFVPK